ncbi:hypothetical protein [Tamilnaduibacter salinus]|uniref:hypothetical protein n=1 Tax=Tamilnaduibacter salinus TaxID=1484056 RepID=UPI001B803D66|nr:hypothetical protein [Tamilnaduibacter salinus]
MTETSPTEYEETLDSILEQVGREETLVNNRLTWLLVFHGLLLNGIVQSAEQPPDQRLVTVLITGIPVVGVLTALLGLLGVSAAYCSIRSIQALYHSLETENRIRRTTENLERITDLRDELDRQLKHLEKQAETAERYKTLKQSERRLKAELTVLRWQGLDEELATIVSASRKWSLSRSGW